MSVSSTFVLVWGAWWLEGCNELGSIVCDSTLKYNKYIVDIEIQFDLKFD